MLLSNGVFTQPSTSALASVSAGDGTRGSRGEADQTNRSRAGMSPGLCKVGASERAPVGRHAGWASRPECPTSQTRRLVQQTPRARSEVVEAAVPPGASGEARGARARLSGGDDLETTPRLVEERRRQVERPLLVGRQAIAPQAALGKALQL